MIELIINNKDGTCSPYYIEKIFNERGEAISLRPNFRNAEHRVDIVAGDRIDCTIRPVHESTCNVYRCDCGAREMFDKLVNEAGEANLKAKGDGNEKQV